MFRIDDATAAGTLPAPEAVGAEGFFTEGNPTAGTPATKVRGSWLNMIQEELAAILTAAGITRSKTTYNQVNAALRSMYSSVVGSARNLSMSVAAASATATLTADEIIVETALGGQTYRLASFSKTINVATTGAGGMDTGTVPPNGYVALYAIYNPTTQASALLATTASSAVASNVYGGANMPTGYTASALVSVWRTASSLLTIGMQTDRSVFFPPITSLTTATVTATPTSFPISNTVPMNGRRVYCSIGYTSTVTSGMTFRIYADANKTGLQQSTGVSTNNVTFYTNGVVPVLTPQTLYFDNSNGAGTPTYVMNINGYDF